MSEVVEGLTQFAFRNLKANRIEISYDTRNYASCRVAESRGYHLEAIFINDFIDPSGDLRGDYIYAKVRLKDGLFGYPTSFS